MKYCRYCGAQVPDDSLFCSHCGRELAITQSSPTSFKVTGEPSRPQPSTSNGSKANTSASSAGSTKSQRPVVRPNHNKGNDGETEKKSSLWGCTIFFILFAVGCAIAVFVYNSFFTGRENPLIPKDEDTVTVVEKPEVAEPVVEETEKAKPMDGESFLQRRVQRIYDDVLFNTNSMSCVQQYCTDALKVLISKAEATGEQWIDYNFWTYSNDCSNPKLEFVQVDDYSGYMASVKVAIRPYSDGQVVNVIVLKMERENGEWLIDDFVKNGRSVRSYARIAANEFDARNSVADTLY